MVLTYRNDYSLLPVSYQGYEQFLGTCPRVKWSIGAQTSFHVAGMLLVSALHLQIPDNKISVIYVVF